MRLAVILDDVRSVHNVGSIFRTADAAGVEKIYCCGITPGPLDRFKHVRRDFAKVSLGAENSVAWENIKDIASIIRTLKEEGWQMFAIEQGAGSIPYDAWNSIVSGDDEQKIALILGNEVGGVSAEVLVLADAVLEIPMQGKKESLNVSVAFGVVVFDIRSQGGRIK
jgi:tRNA G18 (ribose-2'-O)-methylase SpoU